MPYDLTHIWNLKNKTNEQWGKQRGNSRNRLLTIEHKQMATRREVGGRMDEIGDEG